MFYKLFDYIFYRVFKRAILRNGAAPAADGAIFVTLIQVLTIVDIMLVIKLVYPYDIPGLFYWFVPMIVIISSVNWIRYKDFRTLMKMPRFGPMKQKGYRGEMDFLLLYIFFFRASSF